jgi:SAM-dependent methyltransferase
MTKHDPGWISAHSDEDDDWRRWEASPVQQIDFAVHNHYLRTYLKGRERVLEVGAGAGRFTKELAAIPTRITVADISAAKIARNQRNAQALGYAGAIEAWCECDMCDLQPHFQDGAFDAVVCYGGPLSYVFDRRFKAVQELVRVTRPEGLLFLSAKSLWGTVHEFLPQILNYDPRLNREIVETGNLGPETVSVTSRFWHAYRADEFRAFIEDAGAQVLLLSASDCLTATWRDLMLSWRDDARTWKHLLELEIEACKQPGCLDMGSHILAVARKR